jgi:hypothetical protein
MMITDHATARVFCVFRGSRDVRKSTLITLFFRIPTSAPRKAPQANRRREMSTAQLMGRPTNLPMAETKIRTVMAQRVKEINRSSIVQTQR